VKITKHEYSGFLEIDMQTRRDGNSSVVVAKDDLTKVCWGALHAQVTLYDLCVQVTMNPDEGEWRNLEWARHRALSVAFAPETVVEVVSSMCALNRIIGRREGRKELQGQFLELLEWER